MKKPYLGDENFQRIGSGVVVQFPHIALLGVLVQLAFFVVR